MSKVNLLVLAAAAVAAFVAFAAASASATEMYTESGMVTGGTTIASEAEGTTTLHPPIGDISCEESTVRAKPKTQAVRPKQSRS